MWISFAWTTDAVILEKKWRTRRNWARSHAMKFREGQVVDFWDKSPRIHGQNMGQIKLLSSPYLQRAGKMTDEDYDAEGLEWMQKNYILIGDEQAKDFFERWKKENLLLYVIEFKLLYLTSPGMRRKIEVQDRYNNE